MLVPGERDISYTIAKMGNKPSFPLDTPLGCLLANWEGYQQGGLKKKKLIKYCTQCWPTYSLGGGEKWPQSGSLGHNTILQLSLACKREGEYKEVPYVQAFMALYQDSEKEGKYKLEDFDKCSSKILLAKSETEDPLDRLLTSAASAERPRGREGQTCPEVRRLGPEVTGSKGSHSQSPRLLLHMSPPPWGGIRKSALSSTERKVILSQNLPPKRGTRWGGGNYARSCSVLYARH